MPCSRNKRRRRSWSGWTREPGGSAPRSCAEVDPGQQGGGYCYLGQFEEAWGVLKDLPRRPPQIPLHSWSTITTCSSTLLFITRRLEEARQIMQQQRAPVRGARAGPAFLENHRRPLRHTIARGDRQRALGMAGRPGPGAASSHLQSGRLVPSRTVGPGSGPVGPGSPPLHASVGEASPNHWCSIEKRAADWRPCSLRHRNPTPKK